MAKCLLLFSGGLDSILVAKILEEKNIQIIGLVFTSYFFNSQQAEESARLNKIKIIKKDFSRQHLEIVKKPLCGYGKGLNPCLDCHSLMFKEAYCFFKKEKFDILATGDVLGQRPFSQNKRAFLRIEKLTQLEGKILRPLSSQLLPKTVYEKRGLVNRKYLKKIQGKSRKKQLELAIKFKIKFYPTPSGGCALTEKEYSEKLKKLLKFKENHNKKDFELLRIGRHFWLESAHAILGRNKEENEFITGIKKEGIIIKPNYLKGPTAFVEFKNQEKNYDVIKEVEKIIWKYSNDANIKKFNEINYIENYSN